MSVLLRLRTQDFVMNEIYHRVKTNKPFDKKLKPYSVKLLKKVLMYFESTEEYEKCQVMNEFIIKRINHKENYTKKEVI